MANTGVLPFVRGVDFSRNDFSVSIYFMTIISVLLIMSKWEQFKSCDFSFIGWEISIFC